MPVHHRSSNRVLPANTRAVDVAKRAIRDITPIQQRRYHNAFEVQGYEALVYNRLNQGTLCSCQARRKVLSSLLTEDGKMPEGTINELLTGGLEFSVNRYGANKTTPKGSHREQLGLTPLPRDEQFFGDHTSENNTPFEIAGAARDIDDPFIDVTQPDGSNGPNQPFDLDDIVDDFDAEGQDLNGSRCTCCFGTGFVGGYSLLGGFRKVIAPHLPEVSSVDGTIEVNQFPNAFWSTKVVITLTLPRGFVVLDAFSLWNNVDKVTADRVFLDGLPFSVQLFAALCDGRPHEVTIEFDESTYWTHLEVQVGLSRDSSLIEFPRITQGGNISVADLTDQVSVNASPMIPHLTTLDVLVESTFGKTFQIASSNLWNDKDRNVHGWDCQARVIQKTELLSLLPRRRKLSQQATHAIRDNVNGPRRT